VQGGGSAKLEVEAANRTLPAARAKDSADIGHARRPRLRAVPALDDAPQVHVDDRAAWRAWLEANHATARGAWLVTWRARSGRAGLDYEAAVEEALCFGWVDSTGGRVDDDRGKLYFAPASRAASGRRPTRRGWNA
jgi:hypothetical protein